MLLSQGWTPGTYLGAVDAPHAHVHTDASASHIRVAAKDNNLGIGAKRSGVNVGECTGLDVFQGLLGRLNGKTEAVLEKEQKSRDDLKRSVYAERRWGSLRFVSGGVLVGDKLRTLVEAERSRLAGDLVTTLTSDANEMTASGQTIKLPETSSEHMNRKVEKAKRKLDRRKRKDERRAARAAQPNCEVLPLSTLVPLQDLGPEDAVISNQTGPSSPPTTQAQLGGRHAVRQRYIKQKKMAMMDIKALNEVFGPSIQATTIPH